MRPLIQDKEGFWQQKEVMMASSRLCRVTVGIGHATVIFNHVTCSGLHQPARPSCGHRHNRSNIRCIPFIENSTLVIHSRPPSLSALHPDYPLSHPNSLPVSHTTSHTLCPSLLTFSDLTGQQAAIFLSDVFDIWRNIKRWVTRTRLGSISKLQEGEDQRSPRNTLWLVILFPAVEAFWLFAKALVGHCTIMSITETGYLVQRAML